MKVFETTLAVAAIGATVMLAAPASAGFTITQSAAPAPTYSTLVNFDSAPEGFTASNYYAPQGLSIGSGVDLGGFGVIDGNGAYPWLPAANGNVATGAFGLLLDIAGGTTSISFQAWGDAGTTTMMGGGITILITDGDNTNPAGPVVYGGDVYTPAFGGVGSSWFTITATGGDIIEHLIISNNSNFGSETILDNVSWNPAPAPGALALISLAGLVGGRRRRN